MPSRDHNSLLQRRKQRNHHKIRRNSSNSHSHRSNRSLNRRRSERYLLLCGAGRLARGAPGLVVPRGRRRNYS